MIFVFGSNLAGFHGAGAAAHAVREHGAVPGIGSGFQGSAYAIPTKDENIHSLSLTEISEHVRVFVDFARANPNLGFHVTRIGCGLAGYHDRQIAPFFFGAPDNCILPEGWREMGCLHAHQVTPEGQYTLFRCLDCGYLGVVDSHH